MEYRSEDPYAVSVVFLGGVTEVRWVFSRDLLDEGLVRDVGEGDVQVVPLLDTWGGRILQLRLASPAGIAVVEADADTVLNFLECSYAMVPPGAEGSHLNLDVAITQLLAA